MSGFEANGRFAHKNNVTGSGFPVVRVVAPVVREGVQSEFTTLVGHGKVIGACQIPQQVFGSAYVDFGWLRQSPRELAVGVHYVVARNLGQVHH